MCTHEETYLYKANEIIYIYIIYMKLSNSFAMIIMFDETSFSRELIKL